MLARVLRKFSGAMLLAALSIAHGMHGQHGNHTSIGATQPPMFDVATIKPMNVEHNWAGTEIYPSGRFAIGGATLKFLLAESLDVDEHLVSGGPEWTSTDRYDIAAVEPRSFVQENN